MSRLVERFNTKAAQEYMARAKNEGRAERDGLSEYLATLGISRSEDTETFLKEFDEEHQERTERIMGYLDEISRIAHKLQNRYAGL